VVHYGIMTGMAMTLRLDPQLEAELRLAAAEDRRSVQQTVVLAVETFLALRETAEVRADPEALRALAEARQAVQDGDVVYGTDAVRALLRDRRAS
jgi:PHD/YefM family antitoxin component YafN of YafNO toxin-antitoxin module